jgi:DNA-binding HxlR family transcriptional regulator
MGRMQASNPPRGDTGTVPLSPDPVSPLPARGDTGTVPLSPVVTALENALSVVGDRWTLLVVASLLDGPRRFGDLQEQIPGIATNVLTQRLRALQEEGLVSAEPYSAKPARYSYELSRSGRELAGALRLLAHWGAQRSGDGDALQHLQCGTQLETRWYCPTCTRVVEDDEAGDLRFA